MKENTWLCTEFLQFIVSRPNLKNHYMRIGDCKYRLFTVSKRYFSNMIQITLIYKKIMTNRLLLLSGILCTQYRFYASVSFKYSILLVQSQMYMYDREVEDLVMYRIFTNYSIPTKFKESRHVNGRLQISLFTA